VILLEEKSPGTLQKESCVEGKSAKEGGLKRQEKKISGSKGQKGFLI